MSEQTNNEPANEKAEEANAESAAAATEAPAEAEAAAETVEALKAEIADLKDRLLRAVAETENVRRRGERERQDAVRYAAAGFGRDMVQVSDNLRRAIAAIKEEEREAAPPTVKALIEGVEMTERQLLSTFERHGIREITPQPGDRFDANLHEAMFEVPTADQPAGTVVHVVEAGYTIGDRLLRAARVGVARAPEGGSAPSNGPTVDIKA